MTFYKIDTFLWSQNTASASQLSVVFFIFSTVISACPFSMSETRMEDMAPFQKSVKTTEKAGISQTSALESSQIT